MALVVIREIVLNKCVACGKVFQPEEHRMVQEMALIIDRRGRQDITQILRVHQSGKKNEFGPLCMDCMSVGIRRSSIRAIE
jgi:hypothetical protein